MMKFESGSFVKALWNIMSTGLAAIPWWMYVAIGVMIVLYLFMDAKLPPEPGAARRRRRRAEILFPRAGSRY
ncbi:MAG: hypothetical protein K1X67_17100 [Fimbriimonadaceae bacterium]|nr:hypothetical protein [Fimbriimonadaceae bacterium]